jgi:hypothetical protein
MHAAKVMDMLSVCTRNIAWAESTSGMLLIFRLVETAVRTYQLEVADTNSRARETFVSQSGSR